MDFEDLDQAIAVSFINQLPEEWLAARLVVVITEEDIDYQVSSLEGNEEELEVDDELLALVEEHYEAYEAAFDAPWQQYQLNVAEGEDGEWETSVSLGGAE